MRRLDSQGYINLHGMSHAHLNLCDKQAVNWFFNQAKPEYVFLAAARVGGVCSNNAHEADFLRDNLMIQTNVISAAHRFGVKKLLFMGSACVYPRLAPEPVNEDSLLTGPLEPSNQWYAIAKIAGIKLCQAYRRQHGCDFISCQPTNLYGPGDKYDLTSAHVLPALLRKFHEAKLANEKWVTCWGTGTPTREFLYSDDCADACIRLMEGYSDESPVNIGSGNPVSIHNLATAIANTVRFTNGLQWDKTKPDGTPHRALDGSKMKSLGWEPKISLMEGLRRTYADYLEHQLAPHAKVIFDNMR
jgi:GDP-L-fucose synthase